MKAYNIIKQTPRETLGEVFCKSREPELFARCSLVVTFCSLLVTFCSLLDKKFGRVFFFLSKSKHKVLRINLYKSLICE